MDGFNNLQAIWLKADVTALPAPSAMLRTARRYSRRMLFKKIALALLGVLLIVCMMVVMLLYKSRMLSTRLGECGIAAACLVFVIANLRSLRSVHRIKDYPNRDFIIYLEQVRINRFRYYRTTQVLGLFLASSGLGLYIFEPVHKDLVWSLVAYSLLACYLLFMWLWVRPRAFRRQARKLEERIKEMRHVAGQL